VRSKNQANIEQTSSKRHKPARRANFMLAGRASSLSQLHRVNGV